MAMSAARILTFEVMTSRESTLNFDRREMLIVHDVFRREFALMPGLIGTVAPGDRDRAGLVGDHIDGAVAPSPPRGRHERLAGVGGSMCGRRRPHGIDARS